MSSQLTVGVLALQGAFNEHTQLLRQAAEVLNSKHHNQSWNFIEVRTPIQLNSCDALILPGGESTAISLVAERCGMLEPLRDFVKVQRKPTWGTCAGLILLAESANRTKKGGQELIGGLDVRVNRNHFGRQTESFQANLDLQFLSSSSSSSTDPAASHEEIPVIDPFRAVFIRAPIVEKILPSVSGIQESESNLDDTVVAPSREVAEGIDSKMKTAKVEVLASLPGRSAALKKENERVLEEETGDIVAVRQANVFGTSFHPELTGDARIHVWWLEQILREVVQKDS